MELKRYKLGEIAEILISSIDKKSKEGESPVRLCNFVDVYHNWAITADMVSNFMESTTSEKNIDRFSLKKGYVAFTKDSETRDDIGVPTYIAEDLDNTVLGYHCALVKPDESIISGKYLNAFLHSDYIKRYFELNATGSGMRYTLSVDTLYNIPILAPSLDIQKRIGDLFSNIDRKICINRSLNHYLEAMAKQLYDYWFVQFDFPDATGKPYKSSGGKMVWNEKLKREIPEGWELTPLFKGVDVQYGFPFSTDLFTEIRTEIPIVRIRDIMDGSTSAFYCGEVDDKYRLNKGDIVIGMDGNFHMNYWHSDVDYLNQRCVRLRPKSHSQISALQSLFETSPYIKAKEKNAKGSTVGHLSDKDLKGMWLIKPVSNVNFKPRETFDSLLNKMIGYKEELLHLTQCRNELLPLLMTGQVSVTQLNNDLPATFIIIRKTSQYEE